MKGGEEIEMGMGMRAVGAWFAPLVGWLGWVGSGRGRGRLYLPISRQGSRAAGSGGEEGGREGGKDESVVNVIHGSETRRERKNPLHYLLYDPSPFPQTS